jgi:hypothetical protein
MSSTTYRFSEKYIRAKRRDPVIGAIVLAVLLLIVAVASAASTGHPVIAAIGYLSVVAWVSIRNTRAGRATERELASIRIEVSNDAVCFSGAGGEAIVPISTIGSMWIDERSHEPRTIYLKQAGGSGFQLEGLDRMPQLARQLAATLGSQRVRHLRWWQLAPAFMD